MPGEGVRAGQASGPERGKQREAPLPSPQAHLKVHPGLWAVGAPPFPAPLGPGRVWAPTAYALTLWEARPAVLAGGWGGARRGGTAPALSPSEGNFPRNQEVTRATLASSLRPKDWGAPNPDRLPGPRLWGRAGP